MNVIRLAALVAVFPALGCSMFAGQPHVRSDATLGKVIIYRNGVAYFERRAQVEGDKLSLNVPADRIDDFLKSLTVVEATTGTALPVSFPAATRRSGDSVDLKIQLPTTGMRDLRLSYVTESPAWKPSYRVILKDGGKAQLHAWAVVDNVSGEDWKKVTVGVGSTSALSFRFDLHSVRVVERETLTSDVGVALAPPTGGSPYTVAGKELKVLGNIGAEQVASIARSQAVPGYAQQAQMQSVPAKTVGARKGNAQEVTKDKAGRNRPAAEPIITGSLGGASSSSNIDFRGATPSLPGVDLLRSGNQRVRVEGFAQKGDADPRQSSLERANVIRDQLISQGVSADRVEAVGTGRASTDAVRLVAVDDEPKPAQAAVSGARGSESAEPLGTALFVSSTPMSLEDGRSAMVSLVQAETEAKQVYYYDPVSTRGSDRFAFKAVRLSNPTQYTLEPGPFTVYAEGQFLGEGMSEPIPPKAVAFIPFGLDRQLVIEPVDSTREEIDKLVTIQRGIINTETLRIRQKRLTLTNRLEEPVDVYIRHSVPDGWTLRPAAQKPERMGGAWLFRVRVIGRGSTELLIEESMPIAKTVDIRTAPGVAAMGLYLKTARLDAALQGKLDDIIKLHKQIADMQQRIETLESQMATYRTRVDEIHVQLVTLRQVPNAQQLSKHLAQKMEEISNRLQKATIEVTDLKAQMMGHQVTMQDRLAELTLTGAKDAPAASDK